MRVFFSIVGITAVVVVLAYFACRDTANKERGKAIYAENCVSCHGPDGDGKGPAAIAIPGAKPRDFTKGEFKYGSSPEELFKTISQGVPDTAMPSWAGLPEQDRRDVIAYVRSLKK